MKARDALSDILKNKTSSPRIDSSEGSYLCVTWKQPNIIGKRFVVKEMVTKMFPLVKVEISSSYVHHTLKNSYCDKDLNVKKLVKK